MSQAITNIIIILTPVIAFEKCSIYVESSIISFDTAIELKLNINATDIITVIK
jgi:hypothetical protein